MTRVTKKPFRVLSPTGILGYGFPEASFRRGLEREPHLIGCDAGSTDPGPYYLGSGRSFTDRACVKRDLRYLLAEGVRRGIPVVIGSAGGAGAGAHLAWCRTILEEVACEEALSFRLGVISADIPKDTVRRALAEGRIRPLAFVPELTEEAIQASTHVVAQMGCEPLIVALETGCQVVLAGRCYDPACFAALPILRGYDKGLALHMGKILECGAIAATPGSGADCVLGTLTEESVILEALNPQRHFTRLSAAAHTLYEKSDPYRLPGPGGEIRVDGCTFTELDGGRVEVRGSRFEPTTPYRVKLEAARLAGFRSVCIAGVRDPVFIANVGEILPAVEEQIDAMRADRLHGTIRFHVYGRDGVMGPSEPLRSGAAHELALVIEAVAPTQDEADTLVSLTRSTLMHYGYPGRISTAGNLAFPFSPSDMHGGEVYEFSIYHLMELDRPEAFPLEVADFQGGHAR